MKNDLLDIEELELLSIDLPIKPPKSIIKVKPKESKVQQNLPPTTTLANKIKREARRKKTAEDFTPLTLVNEMLDKLPKEVWEQNKSFCDPACGNGNFLIEVLKRKLENKHDPVEAIKSIYGTDIMQDNIKECRLRLLKVIFNYVKKNKLKKPDSMEIIRALGKNIVCTPLNKYPNGSLDYDFEFSYTPNEKVCRDSLNKIIAEKLLDTVEI